jgi:hypothetical protein
MMLIRKRPGSNRVSIDLFVRRAAKRKDTGTGSKKARVLMSEENEKLDAKEELHVTH